MSGRRRAIEIVVILAVVAILSLLGFMPTSKARGLGIGEVRLGMSRSEVEAKVGGTHQATSSPSPNSRVRVTEYQDVNPFVSVIYDSRGYVSGVMGEVLNRDGQQICRKLDPVAKLTQQLGPPGSTTINPANEFSGPSEFYFYPQYDLKVIVMDLDDYVPGAGDIKGLTVVTFGLGDCSRI